MNLFDVYSLFDVTPVKAKGCTIWDDKGQEYLDLYGGHAVIFSRTLPSKIYGCHN